MKDNVIDFPSLSENNSYSIADGDIGVFNKANNIELIGSRGEFALIDEFGGIEFTDRKDLAEFLWMCASLVDSEERYRPQGELIGANYE